MVQQYQKPVQHSPTNFHPILPIEVQKYTVPIPIEDCSITLDEAFHRYEEAKIKLKHPNEITNCQRQMEFIVHNLQKFYGDHFLVLAIIQATLSNCYWVKGEHSKGNALLKHCICKSLEFGLSEQWLIWVQWFAVRQLAVGDFKYAQEILEPIINKMNENEDPIYASNTGLKASYCNNYGMSLVGQETKESFEAAEKYFKEAINLDQNEPIFVHNLSDLYKKEYIIFNQKDCLENSKKYAESLQNAQNLTISTQYLLKNNLAEIYFLEGFHDKALNLIENSRVKAIVESYSDEAPIARLLETKSKVLLSQNKKSESLEEIDKAITIGNLKMIGSYHLKRFVNFRGSIVESIELETDFGLNSESVSIPFLGQMIYEELESLIQGESMLNYDGMSEDENDLNLLDLDF